MRIVALTIGLVVLCSAHAMADTVAFDTYAGWNLIAACLVPYDPLPDSLFSNYDLLFTTALLRFDGPTRTQVAYDPWVPNYNILLADGYWLIANQLLK